NGDWGNGISRRKRLKAAGYDPDEVQKIVNKLLKK
ncbi:MAG: 1,4-beta-N-acetylmuramidase, partial [Clostridia bacterium]|nr:1,4-beta-N-acetylmuramidase [Clostridia bacterium]